ncbi:MAG: DUF3592 domain-containing protein [Polyangiales bacterium]
MGRKKGKAAKVPEVGLRPVDRSAFDRVDPEHVPQARRVEPPKTPIEPPKKRPRRLVPLEEKERRIHGAWMAILGPLIFFLMRMIAGQNAEAQKKLERVRTTFRPTTCTIEGIQTMSSNKTGRRANYEYSWVVDGRTYRGSGYAPDGPKSGVSDEQLRNAYPLHAQVRCLYDPTSPSIAYLTSSPSSMSLDPTIFAFVGAGMTLAGIGVLLYDPIRRRMGRA